VNQDKIIISGLVFYGHHGVSKEEQELGQKFFIDLEMRCDLGQAGRSDDVADTVDYKEVYQAIVECEKGKSYRLLEALAEDVARMILDRFSVCEVMVRVRKPHVPIHGLVDYVACEIVRSGNAECGMRNAEVGRGKWEKAYICLGSNLGDREENLKKAVFSLQPSALIRVSKASSLYETEPVDKKDQGWFLNQVIEVETALAPLELLEYLQEIEVKLGRERKERWGPRTIDLDILLYGDIQIEEADLKIPHPEMHRRAFVLIPLVEIAPLARHPELQKTAEELLSELGEHEEVKRWVG